MRSQVFRISQGEWVCNGCGAVMAEETNQEGVIMVHQEGCPEVQKLITSAG